MLFQTGEFDNPGRDLASIEKLKGLGVFAEQKVYAEGKHGCWNQPGWFEKMVDDLDAFFASQMK